MPDECVVDAHSLLWFLEGNPKLGPDARRAMADAGNRLIIPVIALAEACRVVEKRKSTIPTVADLLATMDADARMSVEKLDRELLERSLSLLSVPEMHDRLIVATAIRQRERNPSTALITADSVIRASGLVPTRW